VQPSSPTNSSGNGMCVGENPQVSVTITGGLNESFSWEKINASNGILAYYSGVRTSNYTETQVSTFTLNNITAASAVITELD
jgi:hypothetical protein